MGVFAAARKGPAACYASGEAVVAMRLDNTLDPDFPHRLEIEAAVREAFAPHAEEAWDVTILNSRAPGLLQIRILHEGGQRVTEFMIGTDDTPGQIREHVRRAAEKPMC